MRVVLMCMVCLCAAMSVVASSLEGPWAGMRTAWIVPVDDIGADKLLAACVAQKLSATTPLEVVATQTEPDVILRVGATSKRSTLAVFRHGSTVPFWKTDVPQKAGFGLIKVKLDACGQADRLLEALVEAMKTSRKPSP